MRLQSKADQHRYRTKPEVLNDFLDAVRRSPKKTRIVGLANLNPASFEKYLAFCQAFDLVETFPGGYHLTTKGVGALDALERLATKTSEIHRAVEDLQRILGTPSAVRGGELTLRWASRLAWDEIVLSKAAEGPGFAIARPSGAPAPLRTSDTDPWEDRDSSLLESSGPIDDSAPRPETPAADRGLGSRRPPSPRRTKR